MYPFLAAVKRAKVNEVPASLLLADVDAIWLKTKRRFESKLGGSDTEMDWLILIIFIYAIIYCSY